MKANSQTTSELLLRTHRNHCFDFANFFESILDIAKLICNTILIILISMIPTFLFISSYQGWNIVQVCLRLTKMLKLKASSID